MRTARGIASWEKYAGSGEDAHGNEIDTWDQPVDVDYWRFNPGGSQEPAESGHDRVITQPQLYYPGPAFGPHDRVTVAGLLYEVDGDTAVWDGDNISAGCVTRLKRVVG